MHTQKLLVSVHFQAVLPSEPGGNVSIYLMQSKGQVVEGGGGGGEDVNDFTGEQESVTESRQEVLGGVSTGKKGCHGEYVEVTSSATGQKKRMERKEDKGDVGN